MTAYIALLRKDPASDFGFNFPDFPGCVTAGVSLEEARAMAREALDMHVDATIADGEALPQPSSLDVIAAYEDNSDAIAFIVEIKGAT